MIIDQPYRARNDSRLLYLSSVVFAKFGCTSLRFPFVVFFVVLVRLAWFYLGLCKVTTNVCPMPVVVTTEYPRHSSLSKICLGTSLLSQTL